MAAWVANTVNAGMIAGGAVLQDRRWEGHAVKVSGELFRWIETCTGRVWGTATPAIAEALVHWQEEGIDVILAAAISGNVGDSTMI